MAGNWREELDDLGVSSNAIEAAIAEQLAGFVHTASALNAARADPFFKQHEARIEAYLGREEKVRETALRLAAADPVAALEYVTLRFKEDSPSRERPHVGSTLIPMPGIPDAPPPRPDPYRAEASVEEAAEAYRRTGTRQAAERYAHARLRNVISDDFLNQ